MRIPLTGGAYQARSIIANAQRCVNLFPERNGEADNPPVPITHYQVPGLVELVQGNVAPVRGLYFASNKQLFAVIGTTVYYVDENFNLTSLGTMLIDRTTPVSMEDNDVDILLVDGTGNGYTINLQTHAFAQLTDTTGAFVGADKVSYIDTFLVMNKPASQSFYSTLSGEIEFDVTYIAAKSGKPDLLTTLAVVHNEIWLLGQRTTEVWNNAGAADFPFARIQGVFIEHGCIAKHSVAVEDLSVFWLGQDNQGQAIVYRGAAYKCIRVSTHAIEYEFQQYARLDDAIGFCYQIQGHVFYVLTFPSADKTWVLDDSTGLWHEETYTDSNGVAHRIRQNCVANAYGKLVAGDYANGKLYEITSSVYTDDGMPKVYTRGFPHIVKDSRRLVYDRFTADIQVGTGSSYRDDLGVEQNPKITLRWSDDRGASWSQPITQTLGRIGQFNTNVLVTRLGNARDRVFELSWSVAAQSALQGAWIEARQMST